MPTSKVTRHGQITLPASVRKQLGIEEGDLVQIEVEDEKAVLMPKKLVDKSQAYFWSKKWQEGEREADEDIRAGRVQSFDSVDELFDDLEKELSYSGDKVTAIHRHNAEIGQTGSL